MLKELANKYKTDKVSYFAAQYEREFKDIQGDTKKVMEIGVLKGASILMWHDFFPNAIIYGLDINIDVPCLADLERVRLFRVDQSSRTELESFRKAVLQEDSDKKKLNQFDIILDDGSHFMKDQQQTFGIFFPLVRPGGCYVIEDLHTSVYNKFPQIGIKCDHWGAKSDEKDTTLTMLTARLRTDKFFSNHMTGNELDFLNKEVESVSIFQKDHAITAIIRRKS